MTTEQDRADAEAERERKARERVAEEMLDAQRLADWQAVAGQEFPHLLDIEGPTRYTETP